jgi:hypothetical protein
VVRGGQRLVSAFAMTQHIKPDVYPKVEDDATIVITCPKAQAILQASRNWPFDRRDMAIYGRTPAALTTSLAIATRFATARGWTLSFLDVNFRGT